MGFFNKFKKRPYEEDEEEYDEDDAQEEGADVSLGGANIELKVIKPSSFEQILTAADYLMAKRIVLGTYNADASMIKRGDVNRNGGIDATDYLMIKRHFLGTYVII